MSRVEKIFDQMDTDKDNKLTMNEFMEGSRNDPRIVQALSLQPDSSLGTWTLDSCLSPAQLELCVGITFGSDFHFELILIENLVFSVGKYTSARDVLICLENTIIRCPELLN